MKHLQQLVEEAERCLVGGTVDGLLLAVVVGRFHHLEIPAGELVPEQLIDSHECLRDTVLGEEGVQFGTYLFELGVKPFHGQLGGSCLLHVGYLPSLYQSEGVPYLVVEVSSLLTECLVEEDIVAGRCREHHAHAHAVGSESVDEFNGVRRVAERL